jgi:membrane protein implicated in regulation of membrane protease activity
MLSLAYIGLAAVGCLYVVFAAMLGHLGDSGGQDAGGHDHAGGGPDGGHDGAHDGAHDAGHFEGHYGLDGSGHGEAAAHTAGGATFHFPFFSPLALATLAASIGGYGLLAKFGFGAADLPSLLVAVPAALVTSYAVTYGAFQLAMSSRGSSAIRNADLAGAFGEVLTPIPEGGVGEVAAMVGGQRFTAPAREAEGKAVQRGVGVTVLRMMGSTLVVTAGGPRES